MRALQLLLGIMLACLILQVIFYFNIHTFYRVIGYNRQEKLGNVENGTLMHSVGSSPIPTIGRPESTSPSLPAGGKELPIHHSFSFVLSQPGACKPATELVIVIISSPKNFEDRQAVRDTWGRVTDLAGLNASRVFLLGGISAPQLQSQVEKENSQHQDIVQADFVDSYRNLTIKSVAALKWALEYCKMAKYVLKADDDMYINVNSLISALRDKSQSSPTFVMGHQFIGAKPIRNKASKWRILPTEFSENVYPHYTSGTAYAMTMSAVRQLHNATLEVPFFWLEDIYITGLCSRKAGVSVLHNPKFSYQKEKIDGCHFRWAISGHRYSASEKRKIFDQVKDPHLKCS